MIGLINQRATFHILFDVEPAVCNLVAREEILGETLGPFQLCRRAMAEGASSPLDNGQDLDLPRSGVEIVSAQKRAGAWLYEVRDLRTTAGVTRDRAQGLWSYAISRYEDLRDGRIERRRWLDDVAAGGSGLGRRRRDNIGGSRRLSPVAGRRHRVPGFCRLRRPGCPDIFHRVHWLRTPGPGCRTWRAKSRCRSDGDGRERVPGEHGDRRVE